MSEPDSSERAAQRTRLAHAREELVRADGKASILLATEGVVGGVILAALLGGDWSPAQLPPCAGLLWWGGVASGLCSLGALGYAVYPRTRARRDSPLKGAAYYGDVDGAKQGTLSEGSHLKDQIKQIEWIVRVKYRGLKISIWSAAGAMVLLIGATILDLV